MRRWIPKKATGDTKSFNFLH